MLIAYNKLNLAAALDLFNPILSLLTTALERKWVFVELPVYACQYSMLQ